MTSPIATIYLSSTLDDLRDEREAIAKALADIALVKQSYTADSESLTESIKEDVISCDVYIGVVAFRYGYIPKANNPVQLSITELEYQWARGSKKPCLIFLIQGKDWPGERYDRVTGENENGKRIDDFRKQLNNEDQRPTECTRENLAINVLNSATKALKKIEQAEQQAKDIVAQRVAAPVMDPEARRQHPRRMKAATLLLHMTGPDEKGAQLLEASMRSTYPLYRLPVTVADPPSLSMVDSALDTCRTACLLVSQYSLARMKQFESRLLVILRMLRDRTGTCVAITDRVLPEQIPAAWGITDVHELGDWLAARQQVVSGQFGAFIEGMRGSYADFDDLGLLGLQYTVLSMNAREAQELAADPSVIECSRYFKTIIHDLTWEKRYAEDRLGWRPFDDQNTIRDLLNVSVKEINNQEVVPKHDEDNLHGNRIRLRYYPIDPLLQDDEDMRTVYLQQVRNRGLLVVADELSVLQPRLRRIANALLNHRLVSVVVVSACDPVPVKFEQILEAAVNIADLPDRFRIALDPRCELAVSTRPRLRRWLRSCIPETLGSVEAQVAIADRRAQFRKDIWG